ncbi:leukemia-associated protein 7 [Pelobates fuscus]|uniref:leukemia-associated protein 7 n=1 Tax=Pelobates fuscus TaxID=191477 RepID=UPI002FE4A01E
MTCALTYLLSSPAAPANKGHMSGVELLKMAISHQLTALNTLRDLFENRFSSSLRQGYLKGDLDTTLQVMSSLSLLGDNAEVDASSGGECSNSSQSLISSMDQTDQGAQGPGEPQPSAAHTLNSAPQDVSSATSSRTAPTLAQIASLNRFFRVLKCTVQLLYVEIKALSHLPGDPVITIRLKDSIEFRNVCTHMTLQKEDRLFDQDLTSANEILRTIITDLLQALSSFTSEFIEKVTNQLNQILQILQF